MGVKCKMTDQETNIIMRVKMKYMKMMDTMEMRDMMTNDSYGSGLVVTGDDH